MGGIQQDLVSQLDIQRNTELDPEQLDLLLSLMDRQSLFEQLASFTHKQRLHSHHMNSE